MDMIFSGHLRDGDVHLQYPKVIEDQLKSILFRGDLAVSTLLVAAKKHEVLQDDQVEMRLNECDFGHVKKVILEGFADGTHEWALREASSLDLSTYKRFSYRVERWADRPSTVGAPGLTRWFDIQSKEVPSRRGPYEGISELNPIVRSTNDRYGFYYWDGEHWGGRADSPEKARPRDLGYPPGPWFWRGRTSK